MENINIIIGRRVVLFPLVPQDLDHFIKLHREDRQGYMQRYCLKEMTEEEAKKYILALLTTNTIIVFTVYTKEGKASRKAGYVYLSDISRHGACISGIMDKEFSKGLGRQLRKDKYTFSQDALHTLLGFCFEKMGLNRITSDTIEGNRLAQALLKKEKFIQEGIMRQGAYINGEYKNIANFSLLKEEWKNGKAKDTDNNITGIPEADACDISNSVGDAVV